jgi:hypothetical protein
MPPLRQELKTMTPATASGLLANPSISSDQALKVARLDAENAYRDLSFYRILISLEPDGWHIDYEFKNTRLQGGGPHYIIDVVDGHIISKRYEQ